EKEVAPDSRKMRAVIKKALAQKPPRPLLIFREHVGKSFVATPLQRLRLNRVHAPLDLTRRAQLLQISSKHRLESARGRGRQECGLGLVDGIVHGPKGLVAVSDAAE